MKRKYIEKIFTDWDDLRRDGIFLSGIHGEGEFKKWYKNGQLFLHCFYKNGKERGEYKEWWKNGQLFLHCFFKDGEENGEYKQWGKNGQLFTHHFYKNGKFIKDYLK